MTPSETNLPNRKQDCSACQAGFGKGVGSTCHSCEDDRSKWLVAAGALFTLLAVLFLLLAAVFLVGGLDAVEQVRLSISRTMSVTANKAPSFWKTKNARETTSLPRGERTMGSTASVHTAENEPGGITAAFAPAFAAGSDEIGLGPQRHLSRSDKHMMSRRDFSQQGSSTEGEAAGFSNTVVENMGKFTGFAGAGASSTVTAGYANRSANHPSGIVPGFNDAGAAMAAYTDSDRDGLSEIERRKEGAGGSACCGLGDKIKRWVSLVPLDKLKILVVVWQILTVFPSITGADFPPSYSRFLSWIDIVNLDLGSIFSGTCILPQVSFYQRLLLTTLAPLGLAVVLALTYQLAKRRAGIGSASVVAKRAAWSRHIAAGLLLTFLVSLVGKRLRSILTARRVGRFLEV